jgi:small multidrug resistance family-3 protein
MQQLIERVHRAARRYSVLDFGVLKICMFAIGLWTGIKYARPLRSELRLIQATALTSFIYILYITFRKMCSGRHEI